MKYAKMLCWVNKEEKEALKKENSKKYSILFSKNKEDFVKNLKKGVFPVISIKKAYHINTVLKIIRAFPRMRFFIMSRLDDKFTTYNEFSLIVDEKNIANRDRSRSQYDASELIALFEEHYKGL